MNFENMMDIAHLVLNVIMGIILFLVFVYGFNIEIGQVEYIENNYCDEP